MIHGRFELSLHTGARNLYNARSVGDMLAWAHDFETRRSRRSTSPRARSSDAAAGAARAQAEARA
jgi:hypothetical protein